MRLMVKNRANDARARLGGYLVMHNFYEYGSVCAWCGVTREHVERLLPEHRIASSDQSMYELDEDGFGVLLPRGEKRVRCSSLYERARWVS